MTGVQLGGIDPSILRELSGVYKPFVKALKELVSNAFDADADHVHIPSLPLLIQQFSLHHGCLFHPFLSQCPGCKCHCRQEK